VGGSLQQAVAVVGGQVGPEALDPAQVEPAVLEHVEEDGVAARKAPHGDAEIRLGVREVEDLAAVLEYRGCGLASVEPSRVHLPDVGDEVRLDPSRPTDQLR
jgi:hypothetical protein